LSGIPSLQFILTTIYCDIHKGSKRNPGAEQVFLSVVLRIVAFQGGRFVGVVRDDAGHWYWRRSAAMVCWCGS
jgi:hypothetical protein